MKKELGRRKARRWFWVLCLATACGGGDPAIENSSSDAGGGPSAVDDGTEVEKGENGSGGDETRASGGDDHSAGGRMPTGTGGNSGGGSPSLKGSGGEASGGASGGEPPGGSGGGGGGADPDPAPSEESEFVLPFLKRKAFGAGLLLAATPNDSMLIVGPNASDELASASPGLPFLTEVSTQGEVLQSFSFGDAPEPALMAVDEEGGVIVVGSLFKGAVFAAFELPTLQYGYYVLKLSSTFEVIQAVAFAKEGSTELMSLEIDEAGDVFIGMGVYEGGLLQRPILAKLSGESLEEAWSVVFEHTAIPAYPKAITFLGDGRVVTGGLFSGALTAGDFAVNKPADAQDDDFVYNGWLAWLATDTGAVVDAQAVGGSVSDYIIDIDTNGSGGLRILSTHAGTSTLFGQVETFEEQTGKVALMDLDTTGKLRWLARLGGPDLYAHAMAIGREDQTYLAGRYGRLGDDTVEHGVHLARFEADGTPGAALDFTTGNANGATNIAIDTQGGVWISGAWETPFEMNGETHSPDLDGSQFVMRLSPF